MQVDVQGLINQLLDLKRRIGQLEDMLEELEDSEEETVEIYRIENLLVWCDKMNIEIACDGLKQAYLENRQ